MPADLPPKAIIKIAAGIAAVFIALGFGWAGTLAQQGNDKLKEAEYVGSAQCSKCHAGQFRDWTGSHHAAAMQPASEATVSGRFDGSKFTKDGVETTFYKKDGKFWVRTDGPSGELSDYEIKFTFGITPLQQYLIELPGGRLQAFGIAWDSRPVDQGGQRWYHLYPDRKLAAGDPLHWTGIDQNWNYQCAGCHSTNLKKNYNRSTRSFNTQWSEISVGCEACHGPGSNHVAWASSSAASPSETDHAKGFDFEFNDGRTANWSMGNTGQAVRRGPLSDGREVKLCAGCHARREQFSDRPSDMRKFFDAFRVARLEPPLYYPDGQQRDEVFEHGSFLQSKMHAAGVTCSNCHNPHSGKLHQPGNSVCSQCHAAQRFDTSTHHHHAAGSSGAECTSCHMPTTVYMGVDARHDHSMRIPRPDRTLIMGTPNACNQCHSDKSSQWASDAIKLWYPVSNRGAQSFAEAFDLGDRGAPGAQSALIRVVEDSSFSGLVRASALARLARYPSRRVASVIAAALKTADPDVRVAAVAALPQVSAAWRQRLLVPLLKDDIRLVRMDAAHGLAGESEVSLSADARELFEKALAEYIQAQLFNAERPETHANLGQLYLRRGMSEQARNAFKEAMAIDPTFVPPIIALAELERAGGDEAIGEGILRRGIEMNPSSGALHHALGLSLVRQKRMDEALEKLGAAAKLAPEDPRFVYVFGLATHGAGKLAAAVDLLQSALRRHPYDRDILSALISYQLQAQDFRSALALAELMGELEPERDDIQHLIARLRRQGR